MLNTVSGRGWQLSSSIQLASTCIAIVLSCSSACVAQQFSTAESVLVAPQYDTTHVYLSSSSMDAFVDSFITTFGGHASATFVTNVLPTPSSTAFRAIFSPVGNVSLFAYKTPVPFPFGTERNGYLVTDMDRAIKSAERAGAEVIVQPFKDPIGRDAVIQWPGGLKMQFYWHNKAPHNAPLQTVPESRVYVSPDREEEFVHDIVRYSRGRVVYDNKRQDGAEIGCPGETYRLIQIESDFGKMRVFVTDGHLPYPFGYESTGYQVDDLNDTLAKATSVGVQVLFGPIRKGNRATAIVEFPGGYIAEVHDLNRSSAVQ